METFNELAIDQEITIVGHEFDWDLYSQHQAIFHMLRFDDNGPHLSIVGYNHKYQKDRTIIAGIALSTGAHGDTDPDQTPTDLHIDQIVNAQTAIAGPIEILRPLFETEYEEAFEECDCGVYHGICRCLVTTVAMWADRADLIV